MLQVTIPKGEFYDERSKTFVYTKQQTLQLEHSLVSIAKWESKWKKPFFTREDKTAEETRDYIRCMTITQNVDPNVYLAVTDEIVREVDAYIQDPMTATTFRQENVPPNREIITSEIIYHWMIEAGIPQAYEKWHLNRLLTLIKVRNIKNAPPKKASKEDMRRSREILAERRKRFNTRG